MKKRIIALLATVAMTVILAGCGKEPEIIPAETVNKSIEEELAEAMAEDEAVEEAETVREDPTDLLSGKYYVLIEMKDYDSIVVELDADAAPITVTNFMNLVNEGFYDGLTFHRIISGFMMQGGDPLGTGMGGADKEITGEFYANGIPNDISHVRGTISMARSQDPNSASSQFFIVHEDSDFLDGQYAAFGHVLSGMETVDAICENTPVLDNNGTVAPENQPVITKIYDMTAEYSFDMSDEFIPSNDMEVNVGKSEFESYDEIISCLSEGMGYAYVKVMGSKDDILLITCEGTYDYGDGVRAAIEAYPYLLNGEGKYSCGSVLVSDGTAYPIAVNDKGMIFSGGNHEIEVSVLTSDTDTPAIMNLAYLYESFDENGNATYGGFVRDTNEVMVDGKDIEPDDGETMAEYYRMFDEAEVVNFTVI